MNEIGFWATPLLLLPGVALLILSTSSRYTRLHDEVHELAHLERAIHDRIRNNLARRGRLYRDALVGLYSAVALLSLGSLAGAIGALSGPDTTWIVVTLTGISVSAILFSSWLLVIESGLSHEIIEDHLAHVPREQESTRPQ